MGDSSEPHDQRTVFISYAKEDLALAEVICELLEGAGHRCWIASRDIRAGSEFVAAIARGIETSRAMVVVLSSAANESHWVKIEVERAVHAGKPLFPIRMTAAPLSASLELLVSASQWIDATDGSLRDHLALLARDLGSADARSAGELKSRRANRRYRLRASLATGTLGAGLVAVVVVMATRDPSPAIDGGSLRPPESLTKSVEVTQRRIKPNVSDAMGLERGAVTISLDMDGGTQRALARASLHYQLDGGEDRTSPHFMLIQLLHEDPARLRAVKALTIRFEHPDGWTAGPFEYAFPLGKLADEQQRPLRRSTQADWLARLEWANGIAHIGPVLVEAPEIAAILVGEPDAVAVRMALPQGIAPASVAPLLQDARIAIRPGTPMVYGRFEYAGGEESPLVTWTPSEPGPPGVRLPPLTNASLAPLVFASCEVDDSAPLQFSMSAPRGARSWAVSFDDARFVDAEPESWFWSASTRLRGHALGPRMFISFVDATGTKQGPFDYDTLPARELMESSFKMALLADACARIHASVVCWSRRATSSDCPGTPCISCNAYRDEHSWSSVRLVELGLMPDTLTTSTVITLTLNDVLKDLARKSGTLSKTEPWNASIPGSSNHVFLQARFYDGSESPVIRLDVKD